MRLPPTTGAFLGALLSFTLLAVLYGGELRDWVRLQSAEVAALAQAPRPWLALPVLLVALAGVGLYAWALKAKKPASFPGYRALPIAVVVVLFLDFLVLSEAAARVPSRDQTALALALFQRNLIGQTNRTVPAEPERLRAWVKELGPPPYFLNGEPVEAWNLQVRTDCEGPVGEAPGVAPMTFIYCISKDRRFGWITVHALPAETKFGPPGMFGTNGNVQMAPVFDPREMEAEDADAPSPAGPVSPPSGAPFDRQGGLTPEEPGR